MISGYFEADRHGVVRPCIDMDVQFHEPLNTILNITFVIDTGADRTLLSPSVAQDLHDNFDFDIRSLMCGYPLGGIGGLVDTRSIDATLYLGRHWITTPIPIIDTLPGPNTMPSLLGRDIIDDFALFMERRTDRALLLDDAEVEEFINISG